MTDVNGKDSSEPAQNCVSYQLVYSGVSVSVVSPLYNNLAVTWTRIMHSFKILVHYFAQILEQSTLYKSLMLMAKTILYQVLQL